MRLTVEDVAGDGWDGAHPARSFAWTGDAVATLDVLPDGGRLLAPTGLRACGSTRHLRIETRWCDVCEMDSVHLLSFADSGWWGTGVVCTSCGEESGEAGPTVPDDESVDDQLARIAVICADVDRARARRPMTYWEGEFEGAFMYAPCVHELAATPMDRNLYMWMIAHLGGIVKVRLTQEDEARRASRAAAFDSFPDGTILDDYRSDPNPQLSPISMAAKKEDGRWLTQGRVLPEHVRDEFIDGAIWQRTPTSCEA